MLDLLGLIYQSFKYVVVLELADKEDSKSFARNSVWVQLPPTAPIKFKM